MPAENGQPDNIVTAIGDVQERMADLVKDEIELAKAEVGQKVASLGRGALAVAVGAVFGVFAIVFALETVAWVLDAIFVSGAGSLWIGFAITFGVLIALTIGAFLWAWRKLRVGAPTPSMAIDEAKKIRETVVKSGDPR